MTTRNGRTQRLENDLVEMFSTGDLSKDVALGIIGRIGTAGGTGSAIEFGGSVFRQMSMEGRMTVCNMAKLK